MSSDSDLSDINLLVIEITKHRRKWLRKRVRPIKKMANQVKSKYERTRMRYDNVQKAKVKSQLENKQRQLVNKSHTFDWIILAYLSIAGHGHYDACIKPAIAGRTQLQNSPSKTLKKLQICEILIHNKQMIQLEHHTNPLKHLISLLRHQGRPQTTSPHRKKITLESESLIQLNGKSAYASI